MVKERNSNEKNFGPSFYSVVFLLAFLSLSFRSCFPLYYNGMLYSEMKEAGLWNFFSFFFLILKKDSMTLLFLSFILHTYIGYQSRKPERSKRK